MSSHCPTCNHRNAARQTQCTVCGRKLNLTKRNPSPAVSVYPTGHFAQSELIMSKMAVFDIDHTITDPSRREKAARREGYLIGSMPTSKYPKGKKTFIEWFDDPVKFRTDTAFPGAVDYVNGLAQRGHVIAYITGRRSARKPQTIEHLQELGFPIFNGADDQPLVFMKSSPKQTTSAWKFDILKKLQHNYDIHYFFDDLEENRNAAFRLNIPGIYHLPSHVKSTNVGGLRTTGDTVKSNPDDDLERQIEYIRAQIESKRNQQKMTEKWIQFAGEPSKAAEEMDAKYWKIQREIGELQAELFKQGGLLDLLKAQTTSEPRKKTRSARKENPGWASPAPRLLEMFACPNCGGDTRREGCTHNVATPRMEYDPRSPQGQAQRKVNPNPPWPSTYRQAAGCIVMKNGKILMLRRSHKETSKHGLWELPGGKLEEGETPEEAACTETLEEAGLEVRILDKLEPHIDHKMKKVYHGFLAEPIDRDARVRLSEEHDRNKWVSLDQVMKWPKIKKKKISHHAIFLFSQLKLDEARGNPPSTRKLKKAEELYRVFNNKEPENVRKEKIDVGDVWYRVGEGGAWCIGYMSGKETGDEEQRYIHNFNEESKDGDFPEIYATLPDSGKPLIIIRGGSYKIKTDKDGVAWIYD